MARIARVVLPGHPHHITQRGVRGMEVFRTDEDRRLYLKLMAEQGVRFGVTFQAYSLMTNHTHLIAIPQETDSLAHAIGEAHRRYTRAVNRREGVSGYLFQGRFYSCPLDRRHFVAAARYLERNPVRAGLVRAAWEYPWSSAAFHMGRRAEDSLVKDPGLMGLAGDWKRMLLDDPREVAFLRERTRTGRPCGDRQFIMRAEKLTHRTLRPLSGGRPAKTDKAGT